MEQQAGGNEDPMAAMRARREAEARVRQLLSQLLEPAAMERMANIRLSSPDTYQKVASLVAMAYQNGTLRTKVSEEQLKELLARVVGGKRESKITFARK